MIKLRNKYKEMNFLVKRIQYETNHDNTYLFLIQKKLQQWGKSLLKI